VIIGVIYTTYRKQKHILWRRKSMTSSHYMLPVHYVENSPGKDRNSSRLASHDRNSFQTYRTQSYRHHRCPRGTSDQRKHRDLNLKNPLEALVGYSPSCDHQETLWFERGVSIEFIGKFQINLHLSTSLGVSSCAAEDTKNPLSAESTTTIVQAHGFFNNQRR